MLELLQEAVTALQNETATYPQSVQVWMKLMGGSFLASIIFFYSKPTARWILAALVLNILGLVIGKVAFPDASRTVIGTYVHVLFWTPILWAVWRSARKLSLSQKDNKVFDWIFIVWLGWASFLMLISLVFDFRQLLLMWT
jgi:hypothetical protein